MKIFSTYIANLRVDGEPEPVDYEEVREHLRSLLIREMSRRGLWRSPPQYLGVVGAYWQDGALDELLDDAYVFIFVRRLRGLRNQLKVKGDIDPMVVRNVHHFLTERQRKADPIGYRVFNRLKEAMLAGLEKSWLFLVGADRKKEARLCNGALLGFRKQIDATAAARREQLDEPVRRWADDLLPRLVTAQGNAVPEVVGALGGKVRDLEHRDVLAFFFRDVVTPLKDEVRRRWEALRDGSLGQMGTEGGGDEDVNVVPLVPAPEVDEARWRHAVVCCVDAAVDRQHPPKLRRDLWHAWLWLKGTRLASESGGSLPNYSELSRQLGLSRERIPRLLKILLELVSDCLQPTDSPASQTIYTNPDDPEASGTAADNARIARQGR